MDLNRTSGSTPIDSATLAESLLPERDDALRSLFASVGARPPLVVWSPLPQELGHPTLRAVAEHARSLCDVNGQIAVDAFKLDELGPMADWMMLVDVEGPEGPFRYVHYGTRIVDYAGRDMTDRTTAEFGGHITAFFDALYRAAVIRKSWVLSEHEPPTDVFIRLWRRLIIPLFDANGAVCRFAVANLPENELRAGLELMVDPVFVVDDAQIIQYSNAAARRYFGIDPPALAPATLHDITGIAVDTGLSPADLLALGETVDSIELHVRGALVDRLVMTVSAAQHRDRCFYVVVMRLIGS